MQRRKFSREFKLEAVRLIKDRGVAVAQAARDLDVHENVLRKWVRDLSTDPQHAFPRHGQMKPEQLEIDRLRLGTHPPPLDVKRRLRALASRPPQAIDIRRKSLLPGLRPARFLLGRIGGSGRPALGGRGVL